MGLVWRELRWPALVLLLCSGILLPALGAPAFYTRGEPREALVAFDIYARSHWILPSGYGGAVPSKPLLLHWLIALGATVMGFSEFAARLPSALMCVFFMAYFYAFLEPRRGKQFAVVALGALLFSFEWLRAALSCRVDMVHSATLAAAWFVYFDWKQGNSRVWLGWLAVLIGASFLAKGPVAVVLSMAVVLIWRYVGKNPEHSANPDSIKPDSIKPDSTNWGWASWRHFLTREVLWMACVPTIMAGMWYLLAWWVGGAAFEQKFIEENFARFAGVMQKPAHEHGIPYLLGTLLVGTLPGSFWLAFVLWDRWVVNRSVGFGVQRDDLHKFCWVVVAAVVVFYCMPSSKRGVYLLACYPALVVLGLDHAKSRFGLLTRKYWGGHRLLCRLVVALYVVLGCGWFVDSLSGAPYTGGEWLRYPMFLGYFFRSLSPADVLLLLGMLLVAVFSLWESAVVRALEKVGVRVALEKLRVTHLAAFLVLGMWCVQGVVLPRVADELSLKAFAPVVGQEVGEEQLWSFAYEFYNLSFYMDKRITSRDGPFFDGDWVVVQAKRLERLQEVLVANQTADIVARGVAGLKPGYEPILVRIRMGKATGEGSKESTVPVKDDPATSKRY
jgi:4-amino-4-deoxy-L-arabinose transferase-like glycosyltransferase